MKTTTVKELTAFLKAEAKKLKSDWNDVPEWVIKSSAKFFNQKITENKRALIGDYVSEDPSHYLNIIKALRKALKTSPKEMVDNIEFDMNGEMETITMWEPLEYTLTVKQLCDILGIK